MQMIQGLFIIILLCFSSTGCASLIKGTRLTQQSIKIASKPSGAAVYIFNDWGRKVFECETPCLAKLTPDSEYDLKFDKDGYESAESHIGRKTSGWFYPQLFIPFIGWTGALLDQMSGSDMTLTPRIIEVILQNKTK